MTDYYGKFVRKYVTDVSPGPYLGIIQQLSFGLHNMGGSPRAIVRPVPGGYVKVMRVGDLEIVFIRAEATALKYILSSGSDETYFIDLGIVDLYLGENVKNASFLKSQFFSDTFIEPDFDKYAETCNFIYTLDHKNEFITVIHGGNVERKITNKRNDWRNNDYKSSADLAAGQKFPTYYNSCNPAGGGVYVSFSFSPYTYKTEIEYLDRYIDHAKRLCIPILGRGEDVVEALRECEGHPFGKKPFTLTNGKITRFREVVKATGTVSSPDILHFNMELFWPFIPYMREIAYLNVQSLWDFPLKASLQDIGTLYKHHFTYKTDQGALGYVPWREDSAYCSYPAVTSQNDSQRSPGFTSGTWIETNTQSQLVGYGVTKGASIGSVGGLKELFVETTLAGAKSYSYFHESKVVRNTELPEAYYLSEWLGDYAGWGVGTKTDHTKASVEVNYAWGNTITGTQQLKLGDTVIDSGDISMSYAGTDAKKTVHEGDTIYEAPCLGNIQYTTLNMQVGETQTFYAVNRNTEAKATDYTWQLTGGGSLSNEEGTQTVYTAPATNAECVDYPVISLVCNGQVIDSVAVAVNAVQTDSVAAYVIVREDETENYWCSKYSDWYNCKSINYSSPLCCNNLIPACYTPGCYACIVKPTACSNCGSVGGWGTVPATPGFYDVRTAALITQGCCPGATM